MGRLMLAINTRLMGWAFILIRSPNRVTMMAYKSNPIDMFLPKPFLGD